MPRASVSWGLKGEGTIETRRTSHGYAGLWRAALIAAFLLQGLLFAIATYRERETWLYADNRLYEWPAWNLAQGLGLSIDRSAWEDPYLTDLHRAAHRLQPEAARVPAAVFPPGYSVFLGGVYALFGRSQLMGVLANGVLLLAAVGVSGRLAQRALGRGATALVALGLLATCPFFAYWAAHLMSDVLNVLLVCLFGLLSFHAAPSRTRAAWAGVVLGLACLVRPYNLLLAPALFASHWFLRHRIHFQACALLLIWILSWSLPGAWVVRNQYHFGRPMLTSMGLGYSLWLASHTTPTRISLSEEESAVLTTELRAAAGISDVHRHDDSQRLLELAAARVWREPLRYALTCLVRLPRLWVPLGTRRPGFARGALLTAYGLGMLTLTLVGLTAAVRSSNPLLLGSALVVVYYTVIFAALHTEGRYVLPARPFASILAAVGVEQLLERARRASRPLASS